MKWRGLIPVGWWNWCGRCENGPPCWRCALNGLRRRTSDQ